MTGSYHGANKISELEFKANLGKFSKKPQFFRKYDGKN